VCVVQGGASTKGLTDKRDYNAFLVTVDPADKLASMVFRVASGTQVCTSAACTWLVGPTERLWEHLSGLGSMLVSNLELAASMCQDSLLDRHYYCFPRDAWLTHLICEHDSGSPQTDPKIAALAAGPQRRCWIM